MECSVALCNNRVENCLRVNFQHSVVTVKIPFISQYSKLYTSPDVVLKKTSLEVKNVF